MDYKKLTILILSSIVVAMCTYIATSYGYYVISSNETVEINTITSTPSCIGLTIDNSSTFTIDADYVVPITDDQFFNSKSETQAKFKYSFSVKNDCETEKSLSIGFVSFNGTSDLLSNLKYVLVEGDAKLEKGNAKKIAGESPASIPADIQKYLKEKYEANSSTTYKIGDVTINNASSKNYDLYVWLGSEAQNTAMNQSLKATVILYNNEVES